MTTTTFTSRGFSFSLQGDGFLNARDDFEKIVDLVGNTLDTLSAHEVERLHTGALFNAETGEPANPSLAQALYNIADAAHAEVTRGWHNPDRRPRHARGRLTHNRLAQRETHGDSRRLTMLDKTEDNLASAMSQAKAQIEEWSM